MGSLLGVAQVVTARSQQTDFEVLSLTVGAGEVLRGLQSGWSLNKDRKHLPAASPSYSLWPRLPTVLAGMGASPRKEGLLSVRWQVAGQFSPTWGTWEMLNSAFFKKPETKEQEGEEERGNPPSGWVQQGHWAALASCSCLHTAASSPGLALFPPLGTLCLTLCP